MKNNIVINKCTIESTAINGHLPIYFDKLLFMVTVRYKHTLLSY